MPVSEKKRLTNNRYNFKCDAILLRPLKPIGERIRRAAKESGKSLQGYILDAIANQIMIEEDGPEIPSELITNLIDWLRDKGHTDEEIVDCLKRINSDEK